MFTEFDYSRKKNTFFYKTGALDELSFPNPIFLVYKLFVV